MNKGVQDKYIFKKDKEKKVDDTEKEVSEIKIFKGASKTGEDGDSKDGDSPTVPHPLPTSPHPPTSCSLQHADIEAGEGAPRGILDLWG